ncbi:hypothetical protein [Ureibacillus chungkukjangi]|uniref:CXXC-20-CXXC protein n=1 Tax=Ureibacillus chungkukjangi TaxID=1202712 RepID=A0A318THW1_9BACL|nr:hypothetical protein [Ureibacillus chungkukjangi]PYF03507.1 CXXC-20-CXXC protein [Ureibacillus chungkukjangi]
MKTQKDFKGSWKSELESSINLSPKMKEDLLDKVSSQRDVSEAKRNWIYPTVLTSFVLGAAFFLLLMIQYNPLDLTMSSPEEINNDINIFELLSSEKFYWIVGAIILEIIVVLLFFAVMKKTRRWEKTFVARVLAKLLPTRQNSILIQSFLCVVIGMGIVFSSLASIKYLTVFFVFLLNYLVLLWSIRDLNRSSCPHCGHLFSRKDLYKITWAPYRLKCIHCEENIFQTKASRNKAIIFVWMPFVSHYALGFLGIPFPVIGFSFILVGLFFNFYINNFTTRYSKEDEPMW